MSTDSAQRTARVLERLFQSGHVISCNSAIDVFSVQTSATVKLKDKSQKDLVTWLCHNGVANWAALNGVYRYYVSDWNAIEGCRTVFRPVNFISPAYYGAPLVEGAALEKLLSYLTACTSVSTDQSHVIEPEDGILAWTDHDTGLMWDAGRLCNLTRLDGAGSTSKLLNTLNYAGYNDWRTPTKRELQTLRCAESTRGYHVKPPLAAMMLGPVWAFHIEDDTHAFDFSTGQIITKNYYKDDTVYGYDLCVRGEVSNLKKPWMNVIGDWAAKNDISIPFDEFDLDSLHHLDIWSHKFLRVEHIPDELANLQKIEEVTISSVPAKLIPDFMTQYPLLQKLKIFNCKFDSSAELLISPSITHIEISGGFSDLPVCLSNLPKLNYIYLTSCSELHHNEAARSYLREFVALGGKLHLGSYMKYEDYGLTKSLNGGHAELDE